MDPGTLKYQEDCLGIPIDPRVRMVLMEFNSLLSDKKKIVNQMRVTAIDGNGNDLLQAGHIDSVTFTKTFRIAENKVFGGVVAPKVGDIWEKREEILIGDKVE
mmetsp:Transcript_15573/g.23892  ORF Transcript_15573/g.23892 Transcript_15573/m.23892 type:complete len:103 (-) Transcript_15573:149-457(-)|eukprot:CAMPEP_0170498980 /NCGR_PEP_ID=MMETSP0208-20121228/29681_1 /TAXON_ID=197538 /ORGANISM="Strombidium inclinatum, Strain S3" /LENGTH=102 /DNA_ID=CAMNT_0010776353 /DNA_START=588 /DNA_END=896 /DNA_ORIENTATION=+